MRKADYERKFNHIFGTHIRWRKLTKEELAQLDRALKDITGLLEARPRLEEGSPEGRARESGCRNTAGGISWEVFGGCGKR